MENFFLSYDLEENKNNSAISFKVNFYNEVQSFQIEEIYAMLFRYVKFLSDKFSHNNIRDCVVTTPAFFGYKERKALENAIDMSGLNLITFVNENVAAAVQYFVDKNMGNQTRNLIFYNMGSSYTQVALVQYTTDFESVKGKNQEMKRMKVSRD